MSQVPILFPEAGARFLFGRSSATVFLLKKMFNFAVDPQRSGTSFEIFFRDMFGSSTKKQIFPFRPVSIDISGITQSKIKMAQSLVQSVPVSMLKVKHSSSVTSGRLDVKYKVKEQQMVIGRDAYS
jgi:hypothetical protein